MKPVLKLLLALLLIVATLVAGGCTGGETGTVTMEPLQPGTEAPDFELLALDGLPVTLSQFKGQPVMINFWASWCTPCVYEMPFLEEVANDTDYADQGLVVLGMNLREAPARAADFADEYGITFPILLDTDGKVMERYNVLGVPVTIFIDRDGIVQYVKRGPFLQKSEIETILEHTILANGSQKLADGTQEEQ